MLGGRSITGAAVREKSWEKASTPVQLGKKKGTICGEDVARPRGFEPLTFGSVAVKLGPQRGRRAVIDPDGRPRMRLDAYM
jgi:hypothetical protein